MTYKTMQAFTNDRQIIHFKQVRQYYRVLQDDEMDESIYMRPESGNTPMVFRLEEHHYTPLDRLWQEFWFGLNRSSDWPADHQAWLSYTGNHKAVTNDHGIMDRGIQIGRDYIGKSGLDLPLPAIATLIFGRNVLCGIEEKLTERVGPLLPGTWVLKVETLRKPDFSVTPESHRHLVHTANIITDTLAPNGLRKVNAFPERGGREGLPVYVPLISSKQVYYPMDRLQKMRLGSELPSPYNPP